jgi:hypothetical protein
MEPPATTEAALLEWASGADARIDALTNRLTYVQHVIFALCLVFFFHCVNQILCPASQQHFRRYKH